MITPTRMLLMAPELLMGNRVLRISPVTYPPDRFLRVIFRDDNGGKVTVQGIGDKLIDFYIKDKLYAGLSVAG